jgi:hypothetical protein
MKTRLVPALALLAAAALPGFAQNGKPDAEGFIRDWLVLAPYPAEDMGSNEIDRKQFADEAKPAAREGAKQKIGDQELTWQKVAAKDFFIDFKALHPDRSEHVAAWAVAYVVAPAQLTGLTLRMNSNDQGKVYLNGAEVVKFTDTRTLEKDAEDPAKDVTLMRGVNVVVLKVVNEENNWQGSVRFMDKDGKPLTNLKVQTTPDAK